MWFTESARLWRKLPDDLAKNGLLESPRYLRNNMGRAKKRPRKGTSLGRSIEERFKRHSRQTKQFSSQSAPKLLTC